MLVSRPSLRVAAAMARTVIIALRAALTAARAIPARQRRQRPATCLLRAELAVAQPAFAVRSTVQFAVRIIAILV